MKTIDFYFDFWSPFAYLASHRLAQIAENHHCDINYLPIDLKRAKRAAGNTGPANIDIPPKIRYLMKDLKRWADRYGLPFGQVPKGSNIHRINKGLFYAQDHHRAQAYVRESYNAVWGQGGDPNNDEVLKGVAEKLGWDGDEFLNYVSSPEADERYEKVFEKAVENGVFGVPIFIVDEQMWWGNDRLDFLDEYLTENR